MENIYNRINIEMFINELPYEYRYLIIDLLNKKIKSKIGFLNDKDQ
jgi:hypothetical protein